MDKPEELKTTGYTEGHWVSCLAHLLCFREIESQERKS